MSGHSWSTPSEGKLPAYLADLGGNKYLEPPSLPPSGVRLQRLGDQPSDHREITARCTICRLTSSDPSQHHRTAPSRTPPAEYRRMAPPKSPNRQYFHPIKPRKMRGRSVSSTSARHHGRPPGLDGRQTLELSNLPEPPTIPRVFTTPAGLPVSHSTDAKTRQTILQPAKVPHH